MIRNKAEFSIKDKGSFVASALQWANAFSHLSYFQSNDIPYPFEGFTEVLMCGAHKVLNRHTGNTFAYVGDFHHKIGDYLAGYFGYDLKNEVEALSSLHNDPLDCPLYSFFQPLHIIFLYEERVEIHSPLDPYVVFAQIQATPCPVPDTHESISLIPHMSRMEYLERFEKIRQHIEEGDVYELNLCMGFTGNAAISPVFRYLLLNELSPAPFSCFQKNHHHYLLSASPERFLRKKGDQVLSQPIKGTAPRGGNPNEDEQLKVALRHNEKELAENMMIADLVRNDLARTAIPGTVKAEELFGIYSFRQVHQMITSISAKVSSETHWADIIKHAFPMGSMTGAPKVMAMQLIEKYETLRRGIYSGAAGFITPSGDFDMNVVIRSLIYNEKTQTLGFQVGSAITYDAEGTAEYQECLLKASAICKLLGSDLTPFT
ncbi:anthranilate synthase component I family protein [Roseivirga sp. BDSF3-8]|uniref:anthranilate synthase component I family protein n=1 Tax=Roseivirga sp. BDSF3-8 TaxID=3241598 RepID=UPI0035320289